METRFTRPTGFYVSMMESIESFFQNHSTFRVRARQRALYRDPAPPVL